MATLKQKLAAKKIVENHGNISKSMVQVGYSEATAKNPKNLTESKGFMELMEKHLPDSLLMKKAVQNLNAADIKFMDFKVGTKDSDIEKIIKGKGFELKSITPGFMGAKRAYFFAPNYEIVVRSLDQSYKLKGKYAPAKVEISKSIEELLDEIDSDSDQGASNTAKE